MKIVADENIPQLETIFSHESFEFVRLPGRELARADLIDADILIVRSVTKVNETLLADTPVKFVGTCTIGIDHLDTDYLSRMGIQWANAPGCNANSVLEYVFAALASLKQSLENKRFGIIGCGNVGGHLYRRLRDLGVDCYCYDPFLSTADIPDLCDLETVLSCDIVSLHTPYTDSGPHPSKHLLNREALQKFRPNTLLLSCGRGPVIDNQALRTLLEEGADLRIVLDVWEPEPWIDPKLLGLVDIGTPHIAGYSYDGKVMGTAMIYQALQVFLSGGEASPIRPLDGLEGTLKAEGDTWEAALFSVIVQAYDIQRDNRNLRLAAEDADTLGTAFDQLRKSYPKRMEFRHFAVDLAEVPVSEHPRLSTRLAALGFQEMSLNV